MKLVAETAWHHGGDFAFMKNLVNEIVNNTNADILKIVNENNKELIINYQ